jgi:hypothetical protein
MLPDSLSQQRRFRKLRTFSKSTTAPTGTHSRLQVIRTAFFKARKCLQYADSFRLCATMYATGSCQPSGYMPHTGLVYETSSPLEHLSIQHSYGCVMSANWRCRYIDYLKRSIPPCVVP